MISKLPSPGTLPNDFSASAARWVGVALLTILLAACGAKKDAPATQVAAKVNKEEISVHQINFMMQQQRGLKAEQANVASKQILERLVDQELAVQKAQELKLDRDPRVVQQLEAAKRDIIARAYLEKTGEAADKPTPEEVSKYYADRRALFKERRVYNIQEIAIQAKPEQVEGLRVKLAASKTVNDFVEYLKVNNFQFAGNQAVRPAEQLPLNLLDTFAKMKDGQAMLVPSANGAQAIVLNSSKSEPVDEVRAKPAIEQFLLNDAKRKLIDANIKAMRASAKIEYLGKFAATSDAATATPAPAPAPTPAPAASSGLSADAISKGMGLKK